VTEPDQTLRGEPRGDIPIPAETTATTALDRPPPDLGEVPPDAEAAGHATPSEVPPGEVVPVIAQRTSAPQGLAPEDSAPLASSPSPRTIFLAFLRLGLTSFGGPAMVAYIRTMAVKKKRWLSGDSFNDGVALCQAIPGATAMQSAAYVGLQTRGFFGAAAAYMGFGLPAFVFVLVLAIVYQIGHGAPLVLSLLDGLRAVVVALIANAAVGFAQTTVKKWWSVAVVAGAAAALYFKVSPIFVILAATALGIVLPLERPAPAAPPQVGRRHSYVRHLVVLAAITAVALGVLAAVDRPLLQVGLTMLRIDLFAFGGGFASIPLMQHEFVDVHHWVSAKVFIDGIAIGQITPGPIVTTATFVGYVYLGLVGAVVATICIFLPSFVVLVFVAPYFDRLRRNRYFNRAIAGILLSFVGLLLAVTVRLGLNVSWQIWTIVLAVAAFVALRLKVDIMWVVFGSVVISLVVGLA